ncbi:MSCRAMM family adhesin SdrC [Rathayibacter sp. AY1A5]|uniref:MSCRAMM family adhesin SdrC n=1 Tax=Rathayibacter sp. AY1A5 TaxID=2080523 RepID=UPI00215784A6|nr:MSCRAMM family adhesin SdrC [Rathayibacter sp. AY1A5]
MRPRHDDPDLPDDVQAKDLDKVARNELRTLSKDNAEWVARHLVMAGRLLEEDPELAHRHVLSAARRAGRIAVVRESLAISAYATGDFALALRELRTFRRISGSDEQVPLMVDSERGVGRPDKALELGRSIDRTTLSPGAQVSLAIAMSGARLDLGQAELALMELEIPQLDPDRAFSYSPDLFAAYSLVLEEVGRSEEAAEWQRRADIAAQAVFAAESGGDDETIEVIEEEHESADATSAPDRAEEGTAVDDADDYLDDEDGPTAVDDADEDEVHRTESEEIDDDDDADADDADASADAEADLVDTDEPTFADESLESDDLAETDPDKALDSAEPTADESVEPADAAETAGSPDARETDESAEPADSGEPIDSDEPTDTEEPTDSDEPTDSADTDEPADTTEPAEPTDVDESVTTDEPVTTTRRTRPADTTEEDADVPQQQD